jgi:hypothetical protein
MDHGLVNPPLRPSTVLNSRDDLPHMIPAMGGYGVRPGAVVGSFNLKQHFFVGSHRTLLSQELGPGPVGVEYLIVGIDGNLDQLSALRGTHYHDVAVKLMEDHSHAPGVQDVIIGNAVPARTSHNFHFDNYSCQSGS